MPFSARPAGWEGGVCDFTFPAGQALLNTGRVTWFVAFTCLLIFAAASFFFALAESALFSLAKWQLRQLSHHSSKGEKVAALLSEPQDLLATILLGNTFANGTIVVIVLWLGRHGDWPTAPTLVVLFILLLLVGEAAPKALAVRQPEFWAVWVASPMTALQRMTRPLRRVAQFVNSLMLASAKGVKPMAGTEDEYQELVELAHQQGTIAASEKEIILQIVNLDQRTAKDLMRPRSTMACIADDLSVEEMIAAARQFKHRRLPIYDETPDTIVGVLNSRALLLDPQMDLADAIEFPSFVPESMNLLQLLKSLQRQQRGLAIVLDEFGGTAGVVTLEDILAEMVGEIRSEREPEGFMMEKLGQSKWRVNGAIRWEDFRREHPALGEAPGVETIGGLLLKELDIVPQAGQSIVFSGLRFTAQVVDERRVREVLIEVLKSR